MEHSFSVIIPVYNGLPYLRECLESILQQTYPHYNILVLDSGSTDGSLEYIRSLETARVQLFTTSSRLTIEENWERIKTISRNEFMTIIGQDDLLLPGYLAEMNELINQCPDASLYQTHFNYIDARGRLLRKCQSMEPRITEARFLECQIDRRLDSTATGYMMRSRDYDTVGGISPEFRNLIFADYELWMKLTAMQYLAVSRNTCFCYRIHDSVSKITNGDDYAAAFGKYVYFLAGRRSADKAVAGVLDQKGQSFLLYFCQSLSHRLLKMPAAIRETSVKNFIQACRQYASLLIPGQAFTPEKKFLIRIAEILDRNKAGRFLFGIYQRLKK